MIALEKMLGKSNALIAKRKHAAKDPSGYAAAALRRWPK